MAGAAVKSQSCSLKVEIYRLSKVEMTPGRSGDHHLVGPSRVRAQLEDRAPAVGAAARRRAMSILAASILMNAVHPID
jgi:hypothetical protein